MGSRRWAAVVTVVVVVAVVAFAAGYVAHSTNSTSPTTVATSTTAPTTTTSPAWVAAWPSAQGSLRYQTPTAAALGFAQSVLAMREPLAHGFARGDTRSGEVAVTTTHDGPVTTVLVRQVTSDSSWWVLGSTCRDVAIGEPSALASVASPLRLSGWSTAFEAVINDSLYEDDVARPIASGTTMGGANGVMGPFATTLAFSAPIHPYGVLVVSVRSPKDGAVLEASAIRVAFRHR
ncbi:MAG: Gmad2 immunoglobulin-like domain-containing protein [Acidimicrobiales bacterium]